MQAKGAWRRLPAAEKVSVRVKSVYRCPHVAWSDGCSGSRLVATAANGCAAFGSYRRDTGGGHYPWAIQVIEVSGDRITGHHNFVDARLFDAFGLPARLP